MKIIISEDQLSDLINQDNRYDVLTHLLNKVFKDFDVKNDGEGYVKWTHKDKDEVSFSKNVWGNFWIHNCTDWKVLKRYGKYLNFSPEEFNNLLFQYLNENFSDTFTKGNLVRGIVDGCR
jgi:hypothetical protein